MAIEELREWLARRAGFLDGLCITGGEPTLNERRLVEICEVAKELGYAVKLDTNGTRPGVVAGLVERGLIDYVAVDVKAAPGKYSVAAGRQVDITKIARTIGLLRAAGIDHELRTTVVPRLHTRDDIIAIGEWVGGDSTYVLQPFRPGNTLDPSWARSPAPTAQLMETLAQVAASFFSVVAVRR